MPLLMSKINMPPAMPAFHDPKTKLQITRGKTLKGKPTPFLRPYPEDGIYSRYLVELLVADGLSLVTIRGAAQLIVSEKRIAGLMIMAELTDALSRKKTQLDQSSGYMACFSINHDELGLVGAPTNWRGKPKEIQFGTLISENGGFAIKVTSAVGFLDTDGKVGPITMEQITYKLENCPLTLSRGVNIY